MKINMELIFINCNVKDKNEKYYHIYFNDSKEEIKSNYLDENMNVEKIKTIIDYPINSFERLFSFCEGIENI